ncbi:hypothetical protein [Leifsonia shinshuensis]|uniref:NAD(P)H-binding protein n=1 Tax=Leifsonia shinshuensis TaxID=150026 RepID=A0A7G6YA85_9MICO|nr:hypothetical protein [Leifsonia shinshuensis]QNE35400.1 hypothetical protein F1C12_09845 [Leifsonia shinshuensis]
MLIVVGGFSSLREAPGGPRFADGDRVPPEYAGEAREVVRVLSVLQGVAADWVFVSPAAEFGADGPDDVRGEYRLHGDVAVFSEDGESVISGADFAQGIMGIALSDERHSREHLSLSY